MTPTPETVGRFLLFKSDEQERQFHSGRLIPVLIAVLADAAEFALGRLGWALKLTEVWRSPGADKKLGGSGVHPAWRAVDIRTRDVAPEKVEALVRHVNDKWMYGNPLRPLLKVAYHKPHGTGPHIHLQVHPRTRAR